MTDCVGPIGGKTSHGPGRAVAHRCINTPTETVWGACVYGGHGSPKTAWAPHNPASGRKIYIGKKSQKINAKIHYIYTYTYNIVYVRYTKKSVPPHHIFDTIAKMALERTGCLLGKNYHKNI